MSVELGGLSILDKLQDSKNACAIQTAIRIISQYYNPEMETKIEMKNAFLEVRFYIM